MKKKLIDSKYKLIGILVLIITMFLYKATDLITFAKNSAEKRYDVYTVEVGEIPVLKTSIGQKELVPTITPSQTKTLTSFNINTLTSKAVYIEDIDTATQLFEKNAERLLLPASTTKIMTALVVRDEFELDKIVTVPYIPEVENLRTGGFVGTQVTVRNLLKAALIQSSNESAYALALIHQDGLQGFVNLMNAKASNLGLKSTFFENPAGFDDEKQRSSAHDLAILSKELMKDDFLKEVVGIKEEVVTDITGTFKHYLYNTHQLLGADASVVGIKTGTTQGASEVLITQFNREDRNILIVIMGSEDRYKETSQLIDWVFDNYIWLTPKQIIEKS